MDSSSGGQPFWFVDDPAALQLAAQKATATVTAVLARMGKCGNPACTSCDAVNLKLIDAAVASLKELADLHNKNEEARLAASMGFAVLALGGRYVVDARAMQPGQGIKLECEELEPGLVAWTASLPGAGGGR